MLLRELRAVRAARRFTDFARLVYPRYDDAAHLRILAEKLEAVERGDITRLIVTMPPRHGKTWTTSHLFPSWFLGRNPERYVIAATYAQDFADDIGRAVRNIIAGEEFAEAFPSCKLADDNASIRRFSTNHGGSYFAVGAGGPITGRGADLLLIDDPIKGREDADSETMRRQLRDWYTAVAYTRLMPGGRVVLIQTRWREDDLAGWLLKEHAHEEWETVDFPAILPDGSPLWPERFDLDALKRIERTLPSRDWSALYMQRPTVEEGGILKRHWWQRWSRSEPPPIEHVVLSLDTAFSEKDSADFSAATVWGYFRSKDTEDDTKSPKVYDNIILLDAWQGRVDFPDLRAQCKALIKKHEPDTVLIEKKASGQSLIQELRRQGIPVVAYTPDRDKVARAYSVQSIFESDCVWAPAGKSFADMVIDQCAAFPTGAHDDLVDCTVQALIRFRQSGRLSLDTDPFDEPAPKEPRKRDFSYYA